MNRLMALMALSVNVSMMVSLGLGCGIVFVSVMATAVPFLVLVFKVLIIKGILIIGGDNGAAGCRQRQPVM
jgi:hypothetical protein